MLHSVLGCACPYLEFSQEGPAGLKCVSFAEGTAYFVDCFRLPRNRGQLPLLAVLRLQQMQAPALLWVAPRSQAVQEGALLSVRERSTLGDLSPRGRCSHQPPSQ
jgi:hypothetical protein